MTTDGQALLLRWWGKAGRTYFVQTSPTLNPGSSWHYEGSILMGSDAFLSLSLPAQPSPSFFRLRYSDLPVTGDPLDADHDQDGLSNRAEIRQHGTDPLNHDTDKDLLPDGWEVQYGLHALSAEGSSGSQGDPDGDTLKNLIEYQLGSSPINADTDGDMLPDWWEFHNQTSLISNLGQDGAEGDLDQDGYTNLQEYRVLSDPRNASSYPGSGGPRQEFGGGGNTTPNPSFAAFLARRVRQMSFGSSHRFFRPIIYDWDIYHEHEVPNASPPPPPDDQFNGDADVNGNTQDPGDPRDIPDPWEPTIWERCDPDSPGAIMRKELTMFSEMDLSCDTPAEEERYSHYVITNAYPGEGGRLEVEDSSLEFSRSKALAAMESLPMYQGSPENGWMGAGRWGTFVSTVTSQWHYQVDEEEELCCYGQDGQIWNSYPFYMSYVTMSQEEVRNQCNQPAPAALTQAFVLVKREIDLSGPGSGAGNTETVTVLGSLELRIEEGQMISSQASANFPLPEGVSVQGGTILLTSPPVAPGNKASYDLLPVELRDIKDHANTGDDVTIANWDTAQQIADNNIAWIEAHSSATDAAPRMPQLELRIPGLGQGMTIEAKIEVQYDRGNGQRTARNQPEDRVRIPDNGNYQAVTGDTWRLWESYAGQPFFGGEATLTYRLMNGQNQAMAPQTVRFRIGGKNPDPARAKTHIETLNNAGPQGPLWFAYAIAKSETKDYNGGGTRYNHFWQLPRDANDTSYRAMRQTHAGRPIWNNDGNNQNGVPLPGGYGLFQVTGNAADSEANIPRAQIWHWQENALAGMAILESKRTIADTWMTRQKNANNANGVALQSLTVQSVTFAESTNRTMNNAVTMKLWNGASKPPSTFTDPEPIPLGFLIDTQGSDHFCYWKNSASGTNKWALNRYNNPHGNTQPFNYVDRVCQEVE